MTEGRVSSDVTEVLAYIKASAEAHPDLDVRGLLAQASYVYAVDGWERVRRAAHIELFPVSAPARTPS